MFTDYRRKPNNLKLRDLLNVQFDEIEDLLQMISDWRTVERAEGKILDNLGEDIGQSRQDMTDEVYRIMIKAKLLANNSKGDVFSIVELISTILRLEPGEFAISEAYVDDIYDSGMINIEEVPLRVMLESGLTSDEFLLLVKSTLAAGVGINKLELSGTFEFVESLVQNHEQGFADVEMTTGGTLGKIFEDGDV